MKPLVSFFDHLHTTPAGGSDAIVLTIKSLYMILNHETMLPTDVVSSVEHITDVSKSDETPDGGLSAVFMNIASGKTLVEIAKKHADRVSKDFAELEEANTQFSALFELSKHLNNGGRLENCTKTIDALNDGLESFDKVNDDKSKDDAHQRFIESAIEALKVICPELGKEIINTEFIPFMAKAEEALRQKKYEQLPNTIFLLGANVDSILSRHSMLEGNAKMLLCAKHLYALLSASLDVFLDLKDGHNINSVTVAKFIKKIDQFLKKNNSLLNANASDLMKTLIKHFMDICYVQVAHDADSCAVKLAHLMVKA